MACNVVNTFSSYNNQAKDYPPKEKLPVSWIPQHLLVIYPQEFENDYAMSIADVVNSSSKYMTTGEFDVIPIIGKKISVDDVVEFSQIESYVKYWIPPTDIIRLDDDAFWLLHQIPTGEIALITESDEELYNAIILSDHYFYSIHSNNNEDENENENIDGNNDNNIDYQNDTDNYEIESDNAMTTDDEETDEDFEMDSYDELDYNYSGSNDTE